MADNKRVFVSAVAGAVVASLLSVAGVSLIQKHEGIRYTSYPDPGTGGAPWTICFGHTTGVIPGQVATHEQCQKWLRQDLLVAESCVQRNVKVPLTQTEYDSYTSFVFNAGCKNFATSTMLVLINKQKYREACNQFPRWKYANKRELRGLVKRRYEEQAQCLKPSKVVFNGRNP